jgi:neutral ceramidase
MRVGVGTTIISPHYPVELAGYGYFLDRVSEGVADDLMATAVTLEDDSGTRAALCGVDLISVDDETVSKVRRAVAERSNGEYEDTAIVLAASHTHSGPATRELHGAGGYDLEYIDGILVPRLAAAIVLGFRNASEGELGIARTEVEGLNYNRTGAEALDTRITAVRMDSDRVRLAAAHFACHPVVLGKDNRLISGDYAGVARRTLGQILDVNARLWLTGCAGDIDPAVRRDLGNGTTRAHALRLGMTIGEHAADLYKDIRLSDGRLSVVQTKVEVPVDTSFELDPDAEAEAFRESRKLPKTHDLGPLMKWLRHVTPIVNENATETIQVPVNVIAIGRVVFAGFGAEIYNATGRAIEADHPDLDIVTTMNTNAHEGYVPVPEEYASGGYATRWSAFIFGRRPLTPDSEPVFRAGASQAIAQATRLGSTASAPQR